MSLSLVERREGRPVPTRDGWVRLWVGGPDEEVESVLDVERDRECIQVEVQVGGRCRHRGTQKPSLSVSCTGGLSMGGKS